MDQPLSMTGESPSNPSLSLTQGSFRDIMRDYVNVVKPGITMSNMMTAFVGLWLASQGRPAFGLTLITLAGSGLVVMSGCAFNNYMDQDIDQFMARTQDRPLPNSRIPAWSVLLLGAILGILGISLLGIFANTLSAVMALIGLFFYVIVYTALTKRTTTLSTVIGGVSGAMPPLIGWTAITGSLGMSGWLLFIFMFLWQPPHFLALAMRRVKDYAAAGIPLLPVVYGFPPTKRQIVIWTATLIPASLLLTIVHAEGWIYFFTALIFGGIWLVKGIKGFKAKDDIAWATDMFKFSLIYLMVLCVVMVINVK
ncbi:MAG: heme o synthase [Acidibacillus sp.]|uniref:Protoheme IX farnesyltransferase n=1 Tax=Sulfoacidibacillus ferrooxidans TaxID=2005001 RepID=A0A9X1V8C3_9BACL|nr:Protoheme IX farnesyltransferase 1 [Sulfoacidibacillus ferrooxidans]MCY0893306.1 heme o synthase [Acidibacillus sp.]